MKYANGAIFQGNFYNGLKHIEGKLTEPDGSSYDGFWKNDQRCGLGIKNFKDGSWYDGEWQEDL